VRAGNRIFAEGGVLATSHDGRWLPPKKVARICFALT
jgi:hypothetical protein